MRFEIVFKRGPKTVATVPGIQKIDPQLLLNNEVGVGILNCERLLERITGLRVHINQVD